MSPLYEYVCRSCGEYYEEYASLDAFDKPIPCHCGDWADRAILSAPSLVSSSSWSPGPFHSHYDVQLGEFFETKKERDDCLLRKGLLATAGSDSPETDSFSRRRMTRQQYEKMESGKTKLTDTLLPGQHDKAKAKSESNS